jgi:hypothetical protein
MTTDLGQMRTCRHYATVYTTSMLPSSWMQATEVETPASAPVKTDAPEASPAKSDYQAPEWCVNAASHWSGSKTLSCELSLTSLGTLPVLPLCRVPEVARPALDFFNAQDVSLNSAIAPITNRYGVCLIFCTRSNRVAYVGQRQSHLWTLRLEELH